MPKRLNVDCNDKIIRPTALTIKLLNLKTLAKEAAPVRNSLSNEEIIYQKELLQANWSSINSDKLIAEINKLIDSRAIKSSEIPDHTSVELWLLKALAQGKSYYVKVEEIIETYWLCTRGAFLSALVYNNLGVLEARRQRCLSALDMLKKAIIVGKNSKYLNPAPHYNFVEIIRHLYENNFLSHSNEGKSIYKDIVSSIHEELYAKKETQVKKDIKNSPERAPTPLTDQQVLDLCTEIVQHASKLKSIDDGFFSNNFLYLVPKVELLNSFGDAWSKEEVEVSEKYFDMGIELTKKGKYFEAIKNFDNAIETNPMIEVRAMNAKNQAKSLWQVSRGRKIEKALLEEKYRLAINIVNFPVNEKLKLTSDPAVAKNIADIEINNLIESLDAQIEQENLSASGREAIALKYIELLQEEEKLDLVQKEHISWRLEQIMDWDSNASKSDYDNEQQEN